MHTLPRVDAEQRAAVCQGAVATILVGLIEARMRVTYQWKPSREAT